MATSRSARSRRSRPCSRIITRPPASSPSSLRHPKPSSRRRPNARRSARRGCRNSRNCRCRRRPKSGRPAASAEEEHPQKTRLSLLQRLANVGLGRRDEETEPPIAARASGPAMTAACPIASRSAPSPSKWRIRSRYRSMQNVRRRKVWTSMAARHLLPRRHRATTILISRPSCAARPTEVLLQFAMSQKGPGCTSRGLFLCAVPGLSWLANQLILNH